MEFGSAFSQNFLGIIREWRKFKQIQRNILFNNLSFSYDNFFIIRDIYVLLFDTLVLYERVPTSIDVLGEMVHHVLIIIDRGHSDLVRVGYPDFLLAFLTRVLNRFIMRLSTLSLVLIQRALSKFMRMKERVVSFLAVKIGTVPEVKSILRDGLVVHHVNVDLRQT